MNATVMTSSAGLNLNRSYREKLESLLQKKQAYFMIGLTVTATIFVIATQIIRESPLVTSPALPAATKTAQPKTKDTVYVVKEGDFLWKIAEEKYGSGFNAYDIAVRNKIEEDTPLVEGQKLFLPVVTPKYPTKGDINGAGIQTNRNDSGETFYVVQEGDYLSQIAEKFYGDSSLAWKIIQGNNIPYPELIIPGMTLRIPW